MDRQIERVLDRLDRLGIADDTIVVYLTDNGGSTCNFGDNSPLRGTKYTLWEGGVRVPFIVRWPGVARRGRTCSQLVSSLDLAPTFVAAAGGDADGSLDGRDLSAVLSGSPGHPELHWDCGWQWAVRRGRWKLSWCDGASQTAASVEQVEHASPGNGSFLCDLDADVGEEHDLSERHPEIVSDLTERHERWRDLVGMDRR